MVEGPRDGHSPTTRRDGKGALLRLVFISGHVIGTKDFNLLFTQLLCMLACAGAVAAAPTSGFGSEEALISKVPFIL